MENAGRCWSCCVTVFFREKIRCIYIYFKLTVSWGFFIYQCFVCHQQKCWQIRIKLQFTLTYFRNYSFVLLSTMFRLVLCRILSSFMYYRTVKELGKGFKLVSNTVWYLKIVWSPCSICVWHLCSSVFLLLALFYCCHLNFIL